MIILLLVVFVGLPAALVGWYLLVFQNKKANKLRAQKYLDEYIAGQDSKPV